MGRYIQPVTSPPRTWLTGQATEPRESAAGVSLRLLVVDDDPVNLMLVEAILARWGIEPVLANDGERAVHKAHFSAFDLVLMDLVMPVLDGVAATRRIRGFGRDSMTCSRVPIIAYSSLDLDRDRALLQSAGLSDVLPKPCSSESLKTCLGQWCPEKFVRC